MCGICGYNGKQPSLDLLLNVLGKLEPYVGGKGTGIAFRLDNQICLLKCKGSLNEFKEKFDKSDDLAEIKNKSCLGIAHTRHPSSSFFLSEDRFSHPLFDCHKKLALIHNGSLDSDKFYQDHRQIFASHIFTTEEHGKILDSELLIHMIEHFQSETNSLLDAVKKTFSIAKAYGRLKGFGMFAVISSEEEKIYIAYGFHEENMLEIKRDSDSVYFYTVNNKLNKDIIKTGEEISDWDPCNRDQIIIIEKGSITFEESSVVNEHYNPYDFITPVKDPKLFAGREEELKEIDYYLDLSHSKSPKYTHLALIGERASGKTSLLNMIESMANEKGFLAVRIPLNKETSSNDILFFKEAFDGIMTKGAEKGMYGGIGEKIYGAFRKMIDMLDVSAEIPILFGTAYVGLKKKEHEAGIAQHVLIHDLKELSSEAGKRGIPTIVLLFDECNLLAQNETLLQKIRNAFMEVEGYILAFSGTEKMFPAISDVFSPIPRFFKRINVENFKHIKDTEECLLKPLNEEETKAFDRSCVVEIHNITNGSPYEINLIAHYMYRRWKEGKNLKIGLSPEVLDDVLNEIERLRKEDHHEIANRIKHYWTDQLKVLISLVEFPDASKEWLTEYMVLNEIDTLQPKDVYLKKSILMDYIKQLQTNDTISEKDGKIHFNGDQFDILYLKYFCASKGIRDTKDFFVGFPGDPLINLHQKFVEGVLLKDFPEFYIHTAFDKREKIDGKTGQRFMMGAKVNLPPGEHTILEISPETTKEFYLGAQNSVRFRVNIEWMKEGFVTQFKFKTEEDKRRLQNRFNALIDKFDLLGYKILLKDEISWNVEGTEFSKQGKPTEAIKCFDKAIEINPYFELPWVNKAKTFFGFKEYDKALEYVSKTLELRPNWSEALKLKGMILINLKKNEEALGSLEKAAEINPEDWSIWDNKGRALCNLGNYKEAVYCFDRVIKIQPNNVELLNLRAFSLIRMGNFEDALRDVNKSLEINPENIEALSLRSLVFHTLGKYEEASQCCDKILQMEPENAAALYNKACFESKKGNAENAINCLKKAIELDRKFIDFAKKEQDFDSIRNDERFMKLVNDTECV